MTTNDYTDRHFCLSLLAHLHADVPSIASLLVFFARVATRCHYARARSCRKTPSLWWPLTGKACCSSRHPQIAPSSHLKTTQKHQEHQATQTTTDIRNQPTSLQPLAAPISPFLSPHLDSPISHLPSTSKPRQKLKRHKKSTYLPYHHPPPTTPPHSQCPSPLFSPLTLQPLSHIVDRRRQKPPRLKTHGSTYPRPTSRADS